MAENPPIAKLEIRVLDDVVLEGFFGKVFVAMFNPTEYGSERSVSYAKVAIPGLDSPVLQWVRGGGDSVTLELFADITDEMIDGVLAGADLRVRFVRPLEQLTVQHRQLHRPPRADFPAGRPPEPSPTSQKSVTVDPGAAPMLHRLPPSAALDTQFESVDMVHKNPLIK